MGDRTASQACAQNDPSGVTCTLTSIVQRIGVTSAGVSGDGRWTVAITPVTLAVATNNFGGGPITVAGSAGTNVANMAAGVFISAAGVVTIHCNTTAAAVAVGDPICG